MGKIRKIKRKIRRLYISNIMTTFAIAGALTFTLLLSHAFIMAFLSPTKTVIIAIDTFGEALFELPLVLYVAISATYVLLKVEAKEIRFHWRKRARLARKLEKAKAEAEPEILRFIIDEPKNEPFRCPQCQTVFAVKPVRKPAMVVCPYCRLTGIIE